MQQARKPSSVVVLALAISEVVMKITSLSPTLVTFLLVVFLEASLAQESTTEYSGPTGLVCTNGSCNFKGSCLILAVPGDDQGNSYYTNITGKVFLEGDNCQATCDTGCIQIDQTNSDCIMSAGYTYCPETDECIRPWEQNCPFEGSLLVGPASIKCVNGRCNNLTDTCDVIFESTIFGGPYIAGLNGEFNLSDGCRATCNGCTSEPAPTMTPSSDSSTGEARCKWSDWNSLSVIALVALGMIPS